MNGPLSSVVHILERTTFASGSVVQMFEAAQWMARRGHRVTVVTRPDTEMTRRCTAAGIRHAPLPLRSGIDVFSMRHLARLVQARAATTVHAHQGISHAVALGATLVGVPFALLVTRAESFRVGLLAGTLYRSPRLHRVVAVSRSVRDIVVESARVPAAKVQVVYGGTDTERFDRARCDPARVRHELGLGPDTCVIGHGGLSDWKGWRELLAALPSIVASQPTAQVLLMGCASAQQCAGVLEVVREMNLEERVKVTLVRDDIPDVLATCNVVVDASWAGVGISGTLRDAMALGTPVVATRIGGNPELVEDGVTGLLVPPRDLGTLAAAVSRILRDGDLSARLSRSGRDLIRDRFSTTARMHALEPLYRQVAREAAAIAE